MVRIARAALPLSATMWLTLMLLQGGWSQYGFIQQTLGYLVTEVFYGCVLVFTLASPQLASMMSLRPLRLLGKVSYAVYVLHVFSVLLCARFFALGDPSHPSIVVTLVRHITGSSIVPVTSLLLLDAGAYVSLALGLSVGIALVSWYALELPCLRLKRFFPYGRPA
jgi:peptidoglycan/LPS O-acetylase OafA/YrhL